VDSAEVVRSGREVPMLKLARKAHFARAAWLVAAGAVGGFGFLSLLAALFVIAFGPGLLISLGMLLANAIPFVAAAYAWRRSKRHAKNRDQLLDDAWTAVASDVLSHSGKELEAEELAKLMRLDVEGAERVLAYLGAHDFVHARVTDEGDIAYSSKLRVETPPEVMDGPEPSPEPVEDDATEESARARVEKT
jgi:hypothetical protein